MRIVVYGGSFNPPHLGHVSAVRSAVEQLKPDRCLVIPAADPPHKQLAPGGPGADTRLELTRLAFSEVVGSEVSDMELVRGGKSYTLLTLEELCRENPGAEIFLLVGTDMFCSMEKWFEFRRIMQLATLAVAVRRSADADDVRQTAQRYERGYGASCIFIGHDPIDVSSTQIRQLLPKRRGNEYLPEAVYGRIIAKRLYSASPNIAWLSEQIIPYHKPGRLPHVFGCAQEAAKLALRWGEDPRLAEEAGILHDLTKKLLLNEQLLLCEKYGIINDTVEQGSEKLLHAKTGAALARELFGTDDKVYGGIRWHTTGRANMSTFEKIIYLADYIEPTRDFEGVDKLRELAYTDLDGAMILGLEMSLEDLRQYNAVPHERSNEALEQLRRERSGLSV